ncbi:hypothetical protein GGF46_005187 [Coemansia sp. RSA 552]|nr:hypothetical protein GGF46_005187 [Coemansia sp. RSA 552]
MKRWYEHIRRNKLVPSATALDYFINAAQRRGDRACWESVVRSDIHDYIEREYDDKARRNLVRIAGSCAVYAYCKAGEFENAVDLFNWVIRCGSYSQTTACGAFLSYMDMNDVSVPVLKKGWVGNSKPICGLEPAYPPRGKSPRDKFITVEDPHQRRVLVAELGMAMFYVQVRRKSLPTDYFYTNLASVLGRAKMVDLMQHVFENVVPRLLDELWHKHKSNLACQLTAPTWTVMIRGATQNDRRDLAMRWFRMYRDEHVPRLKANAATPKPDGSRGLESWTYAYKISRPYYLIPQIQRPLLPDGSSADPWYDLEDAELQVEMHRQREEDGLPLGARDARKMLLVYTQVDELRDMEMAEQLAATIIELSTNPDVPLSAKLVKVTIFMHCWKLMIEGYCQQIRWWQGQSEADMALVKQATLLHSFHRLRHWHREWTAMCKKAALPKSNRYFKYTYLTPDDARIVNSSQ